MSTKIVKREFSAAEVGVVKDMYAADLNEAEVAAFLSICSHLGLDPIRRQVYPVKRFVKKLQREVIAVQTSADGYRAMAEETKEYAGQTAPMWCGSDGVWKDVWLVSDPPAACKVGVLRKGWKEPIYGIALWKSSVQRTGAGGITSFWATRGPEMLLKCAEVAAFRRAFPQQLGFLETQETEQGDREITEAEIVTEEHTGVISDKPEQLETETRQGPLPPDPAGPPDEIVRSAPAPEVPAVTLAEGFGWVEPSPVVNDQVQRESFVAFCKEIETDIKKPGTIVRSTNDGIYFCHGRTMQEVYPGEPPIARLVLADPNHPLAPDPVPIDEVNRLYAALDASYKKFKGK